MHAPRSDAEFVLPDSLDGFWMFDLIHAPRPLSPLSQDLVMRAMEEGFCAALHDIGCPFGFRYRAINHYAYCAFSPFASRPTDPDRYRAAVDALLPRIADLWRSEWLPAILPGLERLRTTDYAALNDSALLAALETERIGLVARWQVHGLLLFSYQAASVFDDFCRTALRPADPTEPYQLLQGHATRAFEAQCGLWRLSCIIRSDPALRAVFAELPARRRIDAIGELPTGAAFLAAFASYLDEFGWRSDACIELATPTWREDPIIPLEMLRGLTECDDRDPPETRLERAAVRREQLLRAARGRLADVPVSLARFEALFDQARQHVILDEDHNVLIDQMGNCAMRRPVLELARRLSTRGAIEAIDDVFMLSQTEIAAGLAGADWREMVRARRAELARWATVAPPHTIGEPPPDTDLDPLIAALIKTDTPPPAQAPTHGVIRGTPASGASASRTMS